MHGMQRRKVKFVSSIPYKVLIDYRCWQYHRQHKGIGKLITITVNGDEKTISPNTNVWDFLTGLGLDPLKVAVERNLVIVSKSTFKDVMLTDGDQLEIVHFIGGG